MFDFSTGKDPPAIPLSWAPSTETNLSMQLLREVKQNWHQVISKMFTKWGTSKREEELGEFLDGFENLDFSAFDVHDAFGFLNLINWIESGVSHNPSHGLPLLIPQFPQSLPPLRQRIVKEELPLEKFNMELVDDRKTSVFYRTKPALWGHYTTDPDALRNVGISLGKQYQQNYEKCSLSKTDFFENLQNLKKNLYSSSTRVLIVGLNPSQQCAVVLTPEDKHGVEPLVRYYLPLVKDANWA